MGSEDSTTTEVRWDKMVNAIKEVGEELGVVKKRMEKSRNSK